MNDLTKFKYVGTTPLLFDVAGKEHHVNPGQTVRLPAGEEYVAGLVAGGKLVEADAPGEVKTDATKAAAEEAATATKTPTRNPAEVAPAGAANGKKGGN